MNRKSFFASLIVGVFMLLIVPFNEFSVWAMETSVQKQEPKWVEEETLLDQIKGSVSMKIGPNTCWVTLNDKGELYVKCRHPFPENPRYSAMIETVTISRVGTVYGKFHEMVDENFADKPIISESKLELIPIFEPYFKNLPENFKEYFRGEFGIGKKELTEREGTKQKPTPLNNPVGIWKKMVINEVEFFQLELGPDKFCSVFQQGKDGLEIISSIPGPKIVIPNTVSYWYQELTVKNGKVIKKTRAMVCEERNTIVPIKTDAGVEYVMSRRIKKTGMTDKNNRMNLFATHFAQHGNSLPPAIRAEFAGLYGIQKP